MNKKQKKFRDIYEKFVRKCLQEDIYPVAILKSDEFGIFPDISFMSVTKEQKENILRSLNK